MRIAPDQFEVLAQYLAHGVLPRLRDVHESAIMFDEKIDAIGRELAIDQRARRIELSLERIERRTHFWQRDMVRTPDGVEHVRFDEINEGQTLALLVGDSNQVIELPQPCSMLNFSDMSLMGRKKRSPSATGYMRPTTQERRVAAGMPR